MMPIKVSIAIFPDTPILGYKLLDSPFFEAAIFCNQQKGHVQSLLDCINGDNGCQEICFTEQWDGIAIHD
jgi:hypothetical protein